MRTLITDIAFLMTGDALRQELKDAYVVVDDNIITAIGTGAPVLDTPADRTISGTRMLMMPGFVNTHHHLYQTLFRNVPQVEHAKLFDWLTFLYEHWKYIDEEAVYTSAQVGICEMLKTGVTTTTDHLYLYPYGNNAIIDAEIRAARDVGVRFHPTRGSMSLSKKDGGLPPDSVVQTDEEILVESERVIHQYHDRGRYPMTRIALAPCSPFSVTTDLMKQTAALAEREDVLIHTHLAETQDEEEFCLQTFGFRPIDYMEEVNWLTPRSWFAHIVWASDADIRKLSEHECGMAHCPASNMRLGSGIAPVAVMKQTNMRIGIGVDGSASNDTNSFIGEVRLATLLQRVKYGADALTSREALAMASMGGARVLRMDPDIGSIEVGKAADLIMWDLDTLEFAGGLHDPFTAPVMCDAKQVSLNMVNGKVLIENGQFTNIDVRALVAKQNTIAANLMAR
ncbi:8-oxoguanine deaminase [Candidatus Cryosericum septentrionale]|jgi:8-oxoguanine deaminase|uniref:8-oxoguanine deaminase n=1 Tax=Candidatus Cryosericum septentrionale TaxID=2290913 RepID=A0A398DYK6_9BACT|nr:8-oxoguanine deaminase [Candidatus Cryosericum septentrionale]RIE16977.1 8-oxoguanine deaminase [Candidatus Cryosericum septentrionale]